MGGHEGVHSNAERIARETVTLPLHTAMSEADVDHVCTVVAEIIAGGKAQ